MANKSKKNTTKASKKGAPKRTNKRAKAKAPETIVVEESKGVYTMTTEPTANTNNEVFEKLPEPTSTPNEYKVDNSDIIQENASYSNMVMPRRGKDHSVTYIVVGLVTVILLWAIFG